MEAPPARILVLSDAPVRSGGEYVLYWMTSHRRTRSSWPLAHAAAWARKLGRPLLVFEPLRADYPWASDRFHRFIIEGMRDNQAACKAAKVAYLPYVEPEPGEGQGLLEALADRACVVIADWFPTFFLRRMVSGVGERLGVRTEAIDGNGVMPLHTAGRAFPTAAGFRRALHRQVPSWLQSPVPARPLEKLPRRKLMLDRVTDRWPAADLKALLAPGLDALPLDHEVGPIGIEGGAQAAEGVLDRFLDERLVRYADDRSHPDKEAASGLSPWLHFGHISSEEVAARVMDREDGLALSPEFVGRREGFWGVSPGAEAFLDELLTWREVGYVFCHHREDHASYASLPDWARKTLAEHQGDKRDRLYSHAQLEAAQTDDEVWNAAQRELVATGRITNYLRMLWGKRVIAWSRTPQDALERLVALNNRWAIDGRDPNSLSGIFWCFGRFDRAWGPERPIFGKIRYMTSDSARRKLRMKQYLQRWGPPGTSSDQLPLLAS